MTICFLWLLRSTLIVLCFKHENGLTKSNCRDWERFQELSKSGMLTQSNDDRLLSYYNSLVQPCFIMYCQNELSSHKILIYKNIKIKTQKVQIMKLIMNLLTLMRNIIYTKIYKNGFYRPHKYADNCGITNTILFCNI